MGPVEAHINARDGDLPLVVDIPGIDIASIVAEIYRLGDGRLVFLDIGWADPLSAGHPEHATDQRGQTPLIGRVDGAKTQVGEVREDRPMARLPRLDMPGYPHHVIQRGNNRESIFCTEGDYRYYLEKLTEAVNRHGCEVHAYVLMTNHVHLLVTPIGKGSIGRVMQSLGRRYVRYFNDIYRRTGTLWEGRYRSTLIDSENYLLICMRYIELNPVRAAMVAHPAEYPWSSYRANAMGVPSDLLHPSREYRSLGQDEEERRSAYRALFDCKIDSWAIEALRQATNKAWVLGDDRF